MIDRLLLCTDLDRTLLPNGEQTESAQARTCFASFAAHKEVTLAYVSGRHRELIEHAIAEYAIPVPDYMITDVGTKIYQHKNNNWQTVSEWEQEIDGDWAGYDHDSLSSLFHDLPELQLQETAKQNTHKLSYYVPPHVDHHALLTKMSVRLQKKGIHTNLIWSIDEQKHIGLLDVLPRSANKLHAINFLMSYLGVSTEQTIFAGDSGNDLDVLTSIIPSVLVANASAEIKTLARAQVKTSAHENTLYIANGSALGMNGNYSAGILEGVVHFFPDALEWINNE